MPLHSFDESAEGVFIICATPFAENGDIDLDSTDRLIEFYLDKGVSGMTILGMMGEAQKLSDQESSTFLRHVLGRVSGRVPVIVGVSSPDIGRLEKLAGLAMDGGAGGVMIAPAAGLKDDDEIYAYFNNVFDVLGDAVPVCYQDYPYATGSEVSVEGFDRLVRDYPQLVMLKHEDWPGLNKLTAVRETAEREGLRRVSVMVGNGGLYLPQEMVRGADGAMTGFAYPEMLVDVVRLFKAGQQDRAEDLFDAYLPLVRYEQQPNFGLAIRKETLRRRGVIRSARVRSPGPVMSNKDHEELTHLTRRIENNVRRLT
jgi:4-hydroxy-tetrahydrodipicolinate synthase